MPVGCVCSLYPTHHRDSDSDAADSRAMTRSSNAYSVPSTRRPPLVVGAHHPSYQTRLATSAPRWAPQAGFMLMIVLSRPYTEARFCPLQVNLPDLANSQTWQVQRKTSGHRPGALRRSSLRSAAGIHLPRH